LPFEFNLQRYSAGAELLDVWSEAAQWATKAGRGLCTSCEFRCDLYTCLVRLVSRIAL
jgi:hypothetical protein